MSASQRRVTQRAPQSCVFCARRKLRCSKTIPCTNCIERGMGIRCHREAVILSNQSLVSIDAGRYGSRGRSSRREAPVANMSLPTSSRQAYGETSLQDAEAEARERPIANTRRKSGQQLLLSPHQPASTLIDNEAESHPSSVAYIDRPRAPNVHGGKKSDQPIVSTSHGDLAIEAAMSLESLAWSTNRENSKPSLSLAVLTLLQEMRSLIDERQARDILNFHRVHVAWMHNVVYMPLFLRECEEYHAGIPPKDEAWLSLYCAIICTGVYYMSENQQRGLDLQDGFGVAKRLYLMSVDVIMKSDFMVVQSMHSLQAICVILLCAHAFGYAFDDNTLDARRMKVLLSCANAIAQNTCHRLHLQHPVPSRPLSFNELVDRELKKRVWYFLCTQDWYIIAWKKSYSLVPAHCTTPAPANCKEDFDNETENGIFDDLPLSVQTQSTYMLFLFKLTSQHRTLFDEICTLNASKSSLTEHFDAVLSADSKLEVVMDEIEQSGASLDPDSGQSTVAQWHALVIASWHQRVMIHRSFFCRSFQDRRYHYSRSICLIAARKILRTYLDFFATQSEVEIWTVPAHAISGCFIITLNTLFTIEHHTIENDDMELMQRCLGLLRDSPRPNSIVDRGIQIIQHLLNQGSQSRFKRLDRHEISQLAQDIDNVVHASSHEHTGIGSETRFSDALASQIDLLDSTTTYFGDDEMFLPYWFDFNNA